MDCGHQLDERDRVAVQLACAEDRWLGFCASSKSCGQVRLLVTKPWLEQIQLVRRQEEEGSKLEIPSNRSLGLMDYRALSFLGRFLMSQQTDIIKYSIDPSHSLETDVLNIQ